MNRLAFQVDVLKVKLASAEQLISDQQRREGEARAEINMLTSSMASQQQQHHQVSAVSPPPAGTMALRCHTSASEDTGTTPSAAIRIGRGWTATLTPQTSFPSPPPGAGTPLSQRPRRAALHARSGASGC